MKGKENIKGLQSIKCKCCNDYGYKHQKEARRGYNRKIRSFYKQLAKKTDIGEKNGT